MAQVLHTSIRGKGQAEIVLEKIYRDYQNKAAQLRANPKGRYVPTLRWSDKMLLRADRLRVEMPASVEASLIFIAILSISETFMTALSSTTDASWSHVSALLLENKASIEFFARSRGVPWLRTVRDLIPSICTQTPYPFILRRLLSPHALATVLAPNGISDKVLLRNLDVYGPNTFYLSRTGKIVPIVAPSYNAAQSVGIQVVDTNDCIYDRALFKLHSPPPAWPWREWPRHIQLCEGPHTNGESNPITCEQCHHHFSSEEEWHDPTVGCQCRDWCADALVQVIEYPPFPREPDILNRGVRALQTFEAGTILGEYTGQLVPVQKDTEANYYDPTYLFVLNNIETPGEIGCIAARFYGNWTRYVNHTDDKSKQNIVYTAIQVANRSRIVLQATKRIKFGEEILGHYGSAYFQNRY